MATDFLMTNALTVTAFTQICFVTAFSTMFTFNISGFKSYVTKSNNRFVTYLGLSLLVSIAIGFATAFVIS